MRMLRIISLFLVAPAILGDHICPKGWAGHGDWCYTISNAAAGYDSAQAVCQNLQGDLMAQNSVDEKNFTESLIYNRAHDIWFGLKQDDANGENWLWTDGTQPGPLDSSLVNWACEGRPSAACNQGEGVGPCGTYRWHSKKWENHPCDWAKPFMCRRSIFVADMCDYANGWHHYGDKCYKTMTDEKSWNDAKIHCENQGASLVMLKTEAEVQAFEHLNFCVDYSAAYWIGLSDTDTPNPNTLWWVDNTTLDSNTADWAPNEPPATYPHPHRSNCVAAYAIEFNKWRVSECGSENQFMCQKGFGTCAEGWDDYGTGYCYKVVTADEQKVTWHEAKEICASYSISSQLMKIYNETEQTKAMKGIYDKLKGTGVLSVRIGLNDEITDNDYRWADNAQPYYTHWDDSLKESVVDRMDCGYVPITDENPEARWGTNYCFDKEGYVCRMPIFERPVSNYGQQTQGAEEPVPEKKVLECEEGWVLDGDMCYNFIDETMTYSAAKSRCQEMGAYVAGAENPDQQVFISNNMRGETWHGLVYEGGRWVFDDDDRREPDFVNWAQGGKSEQESRSCCRFQMDPAGQWYNSFCNEEDHLVICEKRAQESATEPPPTEPANVTEPWHPECGYGWAWDPLASRCFAFRSGVQLTWGEARQRCLDEGDGADLASITGPTEQQFITASLFSQGGGATLYWIGLNDRDQNKGWQWTNGDAVPFFHWEDGEPNNYGGAEWCVELSSGNDYRWNDLNCSYFADGYICKKIANSSITTTTEGPTTPPITSCTPQPMVSGSMYITDSNMVARDYREGREPWMARMNSASSWHPTNSSRLDWIEARFPFQRIVERIQIAGHPDNDDYVTEFTVLYRVADGMRWENIYNGTDVVVFKGNTAENKNSGTFVDLPYRIYAQAVRIYPREWNYGIAIRFDVDGCVFEPEVCEAESSVAGTVWALDHYLTASSEKEGYEATQVRFMYNGWEASGSSADEYIQIEFEVRMALIAIGVMGRKDENRYVKKYHMKYYDSTSPHEDKWSFYQDPYGTTKEFNGNENNVDEVRTYLDAEISVDMIQIIPLDYNGGKAMRVEVYACPEGCGVQQVITGETWSVDDSRLSASSSYDGNHGPQRSRLDTQPDGEQAGSWRAGFNDDQQYLQVDLGHSIHIRGIATQGRPDQPHWVKHFHIEYSYDNEHWINYISDRNNDTSVYWTSHSSSQIRKNYLEPAILTRHVRVRPKDWEQSISMRWDILGCPGFRSAERVGCYADGTDDRDLPYASLNSPDGGMTHEICTHHCYTEGFLYAGTQYGSECWCGNSYGKYGQSSNCDMACSGDPFQVCGGIRANTIFTTGMAPDSMRCDDGWQEFDGSCYKFVKKQTEAAFSWYQARALCQEEGADLASIQNQAENDFVWVNVDALKENAWIGLHSLQDHMFFEWANYDSVDYTAWSQREPNNMGEGEDCVNFYYYSGMWNDDNCNANYYGAYVCEKGKESLPPATEAPPDPDCGEGWHAYRWKCYHVVTARESWDHHKDSCEGMSEGASLARIEDNQEQAFISATISGHGGNFYFDLNDRDNYGTYMYTDGSSPSYTHWGQNQPNQANSASCVSMHANDSSLWYDQNCGEQAYAICEKPHGSETRPPVNATEGPSGYCATGWEEYGDYCYIVRYEEDNMRLDWGAAQQWCANHNANLTSVHSDDEAAFLLSIQPNNNANYWIGLSRATFNDSFNWIDGSPVEYVNWAESEPGPEENHNCVQYAHENGMWETMSCSSHRSYMCKIRRGEDVSIPVTEPYPTPDPNGNCEPNGERWKYYNGMCYFFSDVGEQDDEYETWYDAGSFCNRKGGHLASIHSDDELRFCMGQSRNIASKLMWLGLNSIYGGEQWSDNSPLDYTYWAEGQPNDQGGTEMCVGMGVHADNFGPWTHSHCGGKYSYICKKTPGNEEVITTPLPEPVPGNCPEGYMPFLDKCFRFYDDEQIKWEDAKTRCSDQNTDTNTFTLATIHNLQEQSFLTATLLNHPHQYWIGLHLVRGDMGQTFGWVDSSQITYTNWANGEPNGGENEQCVEMYSDTMKAGQWNDMNCEQALRYICMTEKSESLPTQQPAEPDICSNYGAYAGDYKLYNGDCFKAASGELRSWQAAEDHCVNDAPGKGHLASIRDVYEQAFIESIFFEYRDDVVDGDSCWIGLHDYQQPGRFLWTDNSYVTYTNWGPSQPDLPEGGCVQFSFTDSKWYDVSCDQTFKAICRINEQPLQTRPPTSGSCPPSNARDQDWQEFEGACYMFIDTALSFGEARTSCNLLGSGAELASIHTNTTNAFFLDMVVNLDFAFSWWIGMIRTPNNGWSWVDNSAVGYTNWAPGEPSDNGTYGEDCVEMYNDNGMWNDIRCDATNGYVCMTAQLTEPASTTPEPPPSGNPPTDSNPSSVTYSTMGPTDPATAFPSSATSGTTPGGLEEKDPKEPLAPGAIVGIVFAVFALLFATGIVLLVVYKRRQYVAGEGVSNPLYGPGADIRDSTA